MAQWQGRVEPAPAPEGPAPPLIRLDQRCENIELIALWRLNGRAPKLLDLGECVAVVLVSADRVDLHGGHYQNLATVMLLSSGWRPHGESKVGSGNPFGITAGVMTQPFSETAADKSPGD
jgi:hypothetical protein